MSTEFDFIIINGQSLRPAPYVSTEYEYNRSGDYVIGGFLIVTLSGTIVGENISEQIENLNRLQTTTNCVSVIIGCSGNKDFLDGSGRVRSLTINPSDQPYLLSYSLQIAIETIAGKPAVEADEEFLRQTCLGSQNINIGFIQNYSESLSISGDGLVISAVDNTMQISKSYIKASGKITITSFTREICGIPDYNGLNNSIAIIKARASSLMNMNICVPDSPLSQFSGWNKWLDSKSLTINSTGGVEWSFDLYMSKGNAKPYAWIDLTTSNKIDQKRGTDTRTISGTIRGLSTAAIGDIANKVSSNERQSNAQTAYSALFSAITTGRWPGDTEVLGGGQICVIDPCEVDNQALCTQRISSSTKRSVINGEITFNAEFGPIESCKENDQFTIDLSVEENLPVDRYVEYPVAGSQNSIVVSLNAPTAAKLSITVRGSVNGCDTEFIGAMRNEVNRRLRTEFAKYSGRIWLQVKGSEHIGTYSYGLSREYISC